MVFAILSWLYNSKFYFQAHWFFMAQNGVVATAGGAVP
jgi:hypothetical protein